jgi:hypothetical protein
MKQLHNESNIEDLLAMGFLKSDLIDNNIISMVIYGNMYENLTFKSDSNDKLLIPYLYPDPNTFQLCVLNETDGNEENDETNDVIPVLSGIKNNLKIIQRYRWGKKYTGEIKCVYDNNLELDIFSPFYMKQFSSIELNKYYDIYLSGLCYSCELQTEPYIKFIKDSNFEMEINNRVIRFLEIEKYKEYIKKQIIPINIMQTILPEKQSTYYLYFGKIMELESFKVLHGKIVYKITVSISINKKLLINIYLHENIIKNYLPKIGDNIKGLIRIMGYLKFR